jgi:calcium-dependent protein kinase
MGNCSRSPAVLASAANKKPRNGGGGRRGSGEEAAFGAGRDLSGGIDEKYALDRELGRGEFGVHGSGLQGAARLQFHLQA